MDEERTAFLNKKWRAYPPAPAGSVDVPGWLQAPSASAWICGRLRGGFGGSWAIESGGASVAFAFAGAGPGPQIWRDGDLVALRLSSSREATEAQLLAPALQPLGDAFDLERGRRWAQFIGAVRGFFAGRGFVEARTPTLVPSPGTEPYLDAFETTFRAGGSDGAASRLRLHLPTSPEFHLKRLLAFGWTRAFELKDCFRNGECGPAHQPEFLMLEWYRAYDGLDAIERDAEDLLAACARAIGAPAPPAARRTTVRELFQEKCGFALAPDTTESELRALCAALGERP